MDGSVSTLEISSDAPAVSVSWDLLDWESPKPITGKALVVLPKVCPSCGGPLRVTTTWQPALFYGCGYGATLARTIKRCHICKWWIATGENTVNPREFA